MACDKPSSTALHAAERETNVTEATKVRRSFHITTLLALVVFGIAVELARPTQARADILGPSPYLSFSDSPFSSLPFIYFYLEDFEDGLLNTPGVTASPGWIVSSPGPFTDSVDADDGLIDNSGTNGHSYISALSNTNLTLTFDAAALSGKLPTHVGIVWTDVGQVKFGFAGRGDVLFSAFDTNGTLMGTIIATNLGDGSPFGSGPNATSEDRFFGATNATGISSISMSMLNSADWEVDHLQYGAITQPSSLPPLPLLRIEAVSTDLVLVAWPTNNVDGFVLFENSDLTSTNWLAVTNVPATNDAEYQIVLPATSDNRFFQLFHP
jgi:hypothetical protein